MMDVSSKGKSLTVSMIPAMGFRSLIQGRV